MSFEFARAIQVLEDKQAFSSPGMSEEHASIIAADLARVATANTIQVMSSLAETSVFCYVGLAAFHYSMTGAQSYIQVLSQLLNFFG